MKFPKIMVEKIASYRKRRSSENFKELDYSSSVLVDSPYSLYVTGDHYRCTLGLMADFIVPRDAGVYDAGHLLELRGHTEKAARFKIAQALYGDLIDSLAKIEHYVENAEAEKALKSVRVLRGEFQQWVDEYLATGHLDKVNLDKTNQD